MAFLNWLRHYWAFHSPFRKNNTEKIISLWEKGGYDFDYYRKAEQEQWVEVFWDSRSPFNSMFQKLDLTCTLELACGTGRHSTRIIDRVEQLYLLDSSAEALKLAAERFRNYPQVVYIHNKSGFGIPADIVKDNSLTAVFSYDAMVHFEKECVRSYIADSFRVLRPGGYALLHHSNYDKNPEGRFLDNPGWRNYMNRGLFCSYAREHGFEVVQSELFTSACPDSDCITLLKKPS